MKRRYRIVRDTYAGYAAQFKNWWSPFWWQLDIRNTFETVEGARNSINRHKKNREVVEEILE